MSLAEAVSAFLDAQAKTQEILTGIQQLREMAREAREIVGSGYGDAAVVPAVSALATLTMVRASLAAVETQVMATLEHLDRAITASQA